MARAALPGRLTWQLVSVVELVEETARAKSLVLAQPDWPGGYRAGQHVDVRLTAEDGYEAQRSYSIASAPEDDHLVLTVERLEDGEVSPYLVDVLRPGRRARAPRADRRLFRLGGVARRPAGADRRGGSGVVPLRSMLRHWSHTDHSVPVRLIYSARRLSEVIYRDELLGVWRARRGRCSFRAYPRVAGRLAGAPRADRPGAARRGRRAASAKPRVYVCGPNAFVEAAAGWLVDIGHDPSRIRTERFGPTGT